MIARPSKARVLRWSVLAAVWLVVALLAGSALFFNSSRTIALAGHDTVVSPTLSGHAVFDTGPVLPDVRIALPGPFGVNLALGKTDADSTEELFARYAMIASNSQPQVAMVERAVIELAVASALRGIAIGSIPVLVYLVLGPGRRQEIWQDLRTLRTLRPRPLLAVALGLAIVVAFWQPWYGDESEIDSTRQWMGVQEFLGDEIPVPDEAAGIEVRVDSTTSGTQRLLGSALDTWAKSQNFYDSAAEAASELVLREPYPDETVVLLVSDRHDNVGMDRVARAVADRAGAEAIFGGGDDTSTGKPWEAFSLDSLDDSFADFQRWFVTGNHDHGNFVADHLSDRGWEELTGEVIEGPGGGRLLGVPDPRSSGLGNWRDEGEVTFAEVEQEVAETACNSEERVNTILVHDTDLGGEALARGCADLVIGGHNHVQSGPTLVESPEGEMGWSWVNGTTGGAAYALAVGSKPKRNADVTLITYDESGRPLGLQWVRLLTDGRFQVGDFAPLVFPASV